jgi:hypothetical protein
MHPAMKHEIIKKAVTILGSNSALGSAHGGRTSKAENLCEEFVAEAIEDTVLSVKWSFALNRVDNIAGDSTCFTKLEDVDDCIKIALIAPGNLEFYTSNGYIWFKGSKVNSLLYYGRGIIDQLLQDEKSLWKQVHLGFKLLSSLSLASQVAFAMYSDSLFADGLKKQYLIKLTEAKKIYSLDYNLLNSNEL